MDVSEVDATLSFDCRVGLARADVVMRFTTDGREPVFDLRQVIAVAELDGSRLDVARLAPTDDDVRMIGVRLADGDHELRLQYELDLPRTTDPLPIGWTKNAPGVGGSRGGVPGAGGSRGGVPGVGGSRGGVPGVGGSRGVVFDLWMSDLHPGRYLESWIPSPLCDDTFALNVNLEISGTALPHAVFANGEYTPNGVRYPASFTSLSPMLVIAPESRVEVEEAGGITVCKLAGPEIDLGQCHATIRECLDQNNDVFGEYIFGDSFLAYLWGTTRGMEYDGATTSSVGALEHEVFHSWFGRGIKPTTANDGWIDEAFCVWYTAGPPRERRFAQPFDRAEPPVMLRPPGRFDRYTPREAYTAGPRFFAGVADLLGGPESLIAVMAGLYGERHGGFLSTDDLKHVLSEAAGQDLSWAFDRWVHGRDPGGRAG